MPENGTLLVRIGGPVHLHKREMLHLTIADTGVGVNAKDLRHIFEPFFTTKDIIGTGLGLWVTRELINKNNGKIRVRSRLGEGTVFTIWLPTDRPKPESRSASA
jgi:signal transduction histidine kinase